MKVHRRTFPPNTNRCIDCLWLRLTYVLQLQRARVNIFCFRYHSFWWLCRGERCFPLFCCFRFTHHSVSLRLTHPSSIVCARLPFHSVSLELIEVATKMPVKVDLTPPPPSQSKQLGFPRTLLYNGSKFEGSQKCKGNSYAVEVVLQVCGSAPIAPIRTYRNAFDKFDIVSIFIFAWFAYAARRRGEFVFVWLLEDNRTHIRVPDADHILRWGNHIEEISISDAKMGRWWRCRPKTLGESHSRVMCMWRRKSCVLLRSFPE